MGNSYLYLIIKIISIIVCGIFQIDKVQYAGSLIIGLLAFCCIFMLQFLLGNYKQGKWGKGMWILSTAALAGCIAWGAEMFFPMMIMIVWEMLELMTNGRMLYQLFAVSAALLCLVYPPELNYLVISCVTGVLFCFIRELNRELNRQKGVVLMQKEELALAARKMEDMKLYTKTIKNTAVMEERNRFAARIHDQLGHTISGSIILLEATLLSMDGDPLGAKKNMQTVAANLRKGVDDIRHSLRQERPDRSRLGISEIKRHLEEFKITYGIDTNLEVQGDTKQLASHIWVCIQENMKEALTNMLKHSSGSAFHMKINSMNRILRVEYADNGEVKEEVTYGMGLSAIEERTAACGGKSIIHGGHKGFVITNIYTF